jgi:hypothetical protein
MTKNSSNRNQISRWLRQFSKHSLLITLILIPSIAAPLPQTKAQETIQSANRSPTAQDIVGQWVYWDSIAFDQYSRYGELRTIRTAEGIVRPGFPFSLTRGDLQNRPQYEWELPQTKTFTYHFTADGKYAIHKLVQDAHMPKGYIQLTHFEVGTYTTKTVRVQNRDVVVAELKPKQSAIETYKELENFHNVASASTQTKYIMLRRDYNPNSGQEAVMIAPVKFINNRGWDIDLSAANDVFAPITFSNQLGVHVANYAGTPVPVDLNISLTPTK